MTGCNVCEDGGDGPSMPAQQPSRPAAGVEGSHTATLGQAGTAVDPLSTGRLDPLSTGRLDPLSTGQLELEAGVLEGLGDGLLAGAAAGAADGVVDVLDELEPESDEPDEPEPDEPELDEPESDELPDDEVFALESRESLR